MVVAPGCAARLIQELLEDRIRPASTNLEVLLPPGNTLKYYQFLDRNTWPNFFPSPARSFFSTRHLKWLREKLGPYENIIVLIPKSPYRDPAIALATLLTLLTSGKGITLLYPAEEAVIPKPEQGVDLNAQGLTRKWMSFNLNREGLIKGIHKLAWVAYPGFVKDRLYYAQGGFFSHGRAFKFEGDGTDPFNLQPLDSSPEALERDVKYALGSACTWIGFLPGGEEFLKGKKVLEIGPGINFGPILTLACHGAEVLVTDRFLTPWDPDYHPKFYSMLRKSLADRWPSIDLSPLDRVINQRQYPKESISAYTCSLERLSGVADQSVDLVISNAVFEHLYDLKSAFSHLARITKPGGLGLHQIDFRDHRDFSRPLEHLLLSDREFSRKFREKHGEFGNRFRPGEMRQFFELVGFKVREFKPDIYVEEEYLKEFLGRLRQTKKSRYRDYDPEDLRYVSGFFIVVRMPA
jgi:SAM-dependent methyltransferase